MSESAELMRAQKEIRKALRAKFGADCPECVRLLPRANPSILLPQGRCKIHKYVDPRPELTQNDYDHLFDNRATGALSEG